MKKSGLFDKKGVEIKEGDVIELHIPYRTSQTHYGANIPLEPEIKTERRTVMYSHGMFHTGKDGDGDGMMIPLSWDLEEYKTSNDLMEAFGGIKQYWHNDDDYGDIYYLLSEYPPNDIDELIEYVNSCEVVSWD